MLAFLCLPRAGGHGEGLHGRSGSVALPRVKVVLADLAWERARKAERAVEGRRRVLDMVGWSTEYLIEIE